MQEDTYVYRYEKIPLGNVVYADFCNAPQTGSHMNTTTGTDIYILHSVCYRF